MESRKSRKADMEGRRLQGFLIGLIVALSLLFVALEWNSSDSGWTFFDDDEDLEAEIDLEPLKRDKDQIPMMLPQEQKVEQPRSEELHLVDEVVTLPEPPAEAPSQEPEVSKAEEEQPAVVDMYSEPFDVRVVEDLPQFPGGATAFMKWLTQNLKYPSAAQRRNVKGRVVAEFIVNTDGSISDLAVVEPLEASCDREVLRVLRMMPAWKAGVMKAKPCRTRVRIPIIFNI